MKRTMNKVTLAAGVMALGTLMPNASSEAEPTKSKEPSTWGAQNPNVDPRVYAAHQAILEGRTEDAAQALAPALQDVSLPRAALANGRSILPLITNASGARGALRRFPDDFVKLNDIACRRAKASPVGASDLAGNANNPVPLVCEAAGPWQSVVTPAGPDADDALSLVFLPTGARVTLAPPLGAALGPSEPGPVVHFRVEDLGNEGRRTLGLVVRFLSKRRVDSKGRREQALAVFRLTDGHACPWAHTDAMRDPDGYRALLDLLDAYALRSPCQTTWALAQND